jgi:hypothetical protein
LDEFQRRRGHSMEQTIEAISETLTARSLPETYFLHTDQPGRHGESGGEDRAERSDLTP